MNTTDISDTAQDLKDQVRDTAAEWQHRAKKTAKDASLAADRYVRDNVWGSVAVAVIAGCVFGYLLGRTRD